MGIRKFRGLDLMLSTVSSTIGLDQDLEKVFGDRKTKILSIAYYLLSNPEAAMYRFSPWARIRFHPHREDISSPRSSELFGSITEDTIQQFLQLRVQRSLDTSGWMAIDKVEKSFNNLKDRLSLRRTRCSSNDNFSGKVFIQFVALMLISHIRKIMSEKELYKTFSYRQAIDEVDVIEYFEYRNRVGHWGEITEKQGGILQAFNVKLPMEAWPKSIQKMLSTEKKKAKKEQQHTDKTAKT